MPNLIATRPILYLAHQYKIGDILPQDAGLAEAWIETNSAVWEEETQTAEKSKKARRVVAQPGVSGKSSDGDPEALAGNEQIEREKRQNQNSSGIYVNQKLVYVSAQDYGKLPKQGSRIVMDGYLYMVADAIDEGGVYTLTLEVVGA